MKLIATLLAAMVTTSATAAEYSASLAQVGVTPELHLELTGKGVKIGNLDGYPNMGHCDLSGQTATAVIFSGATRLPDRWSTNHATHVISLMAGKANGCGVIGVAPDAYVWNYPFWSSSDTQVIGALARNEARAYNHAISQGARIFNRERSSTLVIGGVPYEEAVFANGVLIEIAKVRTKLLMVQPAGNAKKPLLNQYYTANPDTLSNLILVGGVDANNVLTYSNWPAERCFYASSSVPCPEAGKLKHWFMVAPVNPPAADMNGGVTTWWGTSLAGPLVSGAAALLEEEAGRHGTVLTPTEEADILLESATDLGEPGVDGTYGHGLLNVPAALELLRQRKGWE